MSRTIVAAELDERALRVLVMSGEGQRAHVLRAGTLTLANDTAAALTEALLSVIGHKVPRRTSLVLAIRSRLVACGEITRQAAAPRGDELAALLETEARKIGVYAEADQLVVGYRLRRAANLDAAVCVAPRGLVDELAAATAHLGFAHVNVIPSEVLLSAGLTANSTEPVALLDLHANRAVLVLAHAGRARAVRRFRLPLAYSHSPDNGADVAPMLLGEVTRSLAYFRDQGKGDAQRMLLSGAFTPRTELSGTLASLLPIPVEVAAPPDLSGWEIVQESLSFLVPALVATTRIADLPCLVETARTSRKRMAGLAALQCAGVAGIALGASLLTHAHSPEASALRDAIASARAHVETLQAGVEGLREGLQQPSAVRARAAVLHRIDVDAAARSALCAAIAGGRPTSLALTKIDLAEDGELALTGVARTDDRLTALTALAELEGRLRAVHGLGHGRSSLGETAGDGQIAFRFTARLRGRQP